MKLEPIKEGKGIEISVWDFAQAGLRSTGKGVVHYPGLGGVCRYVPANAFLSGMDEQSRNIRRAIELYDPDNEFILAIPIEEKSEICEFVIVKEKDPAAQLLLGMKESHERFK